MRVCKFGGKCTVDLKALKNVRRISKRKNRKLFVFSAIGRDENDQKMTDLLIDYFESRDESLLEKIKEKFSRLAFNTKIKLDLRYYISQIKSSNDKNFVVSRGEYITTKIMAKFLKLAFVPAEKILFFNNGQVDIEKSKEIICQTLKKYKRFCTCGFYGFDQKTKHIVLLERGGGDTSGALFAKMTNAKVYENYTDVCGVKNVNPQIIKKAKTLKKINFDDMNVLASHDANVLHKSVCEILKSENTKIQVINIFHPYKAKSTVFKDAKPCEYICFLEKENEYEILCKKNKKTISTCCIKEKLEVEIYKLYNQFLKKR